MIMMRVVDIIYSVPSMLYIVLIMLIFGASVVSIMLGISITCWIDMARIVRQQVKSLKEQEFTMQHLFWVPVQAEYYLSIC